MASVPSGASSERSTWAEDLRKRQAMTTPTILMTVTTTMVSATVLCEPHSCEKIIDILNYKMANAITYPKMNVNIIYSHTHSLLISLIEIYWCYFK